MLFRCTWEQHSIFPLEKTPNPKAVKFSERYGNVSERFRFNVILDPIRDLFQTREGMNSSRSLLVLHYNTHQVKYFTFSQWKRLIDELISQIISTPKYSFPESVSFRPVAKDSFSCMRLVKSKRACQLFKKIIKLRLVSD